MEDKIKTIFPFTCPHCGKDTFGELIYDNPGIGKIFTREEITAAKKEAKEKISSLAVDDSIKVKYIDWIDSDATLFSKEEVELIIKAAQEDGKQK